MLERVKPGLQGAGVDLFFPISQVLLHDQTEATDGERSRQREGWPARGKDPTPRWRVLQGERRQGGRGMSGHPEGLEATPAGCRIAWGLAAVLALANVAGYAFDLYARFWWFDRVLHAATILAFTCWSAVFVLRWVLTGVGRHRLLLAAVIACVGVAVGAWWEVAE